MVFERNRSPAKNATRTEAANAHCRAAGAKFYLGDVHGFFGYSFMDLREHEYVEEVTAAPAKPKAGGDEAGPSAAKKAKVAVEDVPETTLVKRTMKFSTLEDSLKVDWTAQPLARKVKRMNFGFFLLHVSKASAERYRLPKWGENVLAPN